ncbi:MAG: zinc-ribbon domain-containing protein [Atopobiaceae bacterium]|nr:zinc-ribbon domain-containing protein [Atopobiaceae bacterium]MBR3161025.1 zinc-ribbon domain-containing protein [Atopobiaceae bacterium]MBR3161037.1 zinc-ribbon domain-containing protein [Atopobiaceae bacterium]
MAGEELVVARKMKLTIEGSIASTRPDLMRYWDEERNDKDPEFLLPSSRAYVHWICPENPEHRWMDLIKNMDANPKCPWCSPVDADGPMSFRMKDGESLGHKHPELLPEWESECNGNVTPYDISTNAHMRFWWRCSNHGIVWSAYPGVRANGSGCPLCRYEKSSDSLSRVASYEDSLEAKYPKLAEEWDVDKNGSLKPSMISGGSGKKVWWICKECGESYMAYPYRRIRGSCCPECSKKSKAPYSHGPLSEERPDLLVEWDRDKNGDLSPYNVTAGSNVSVWWKCSAHGHEWEAVVRSRALSGNGCPICAGKQVLTGFNDLETRFPEIASEWNTEKNGGLNPCDVAFATHMKVWWVCNKHGVPCEWQAAVNSRTSRGHGCPICGQERSTAFHETPSAGESLAELYPKIADEWHPTKNGGLTAYDVKGKSSKRVWWLGKCGHEWQSAISGRVNQDSGCAFCSGKKLLPGFNDLLTVRPDIAEEWHPTKNNGLLPSDVTAHNKKSVWWLGKCGHEWKAGVGNCVDQRSGCPICNSHNHTSFPEKALFYYVSMAYPDALSNYMPDVEKFGRREIDIFVPSIGTGIEYDGERWHQNFERDQEKDFACFLGGIFLIRVREPDCPKYELTMCYREVYRKDMSSEALDECIREVLHEIGAPCDISVDTKRDEIDIIKLMYEGVVEGSFGAKSPHLIAEWDFGKNGKLNPYMFKPFSTKKVWWVCPEGHEYFTSIGSRSAGHGCPKCGSKKSSKRLSKPKPGNSLQERHPELAAEWHPTLNGNLTPSDVNRGTNRKVWWLGKCGHEWETSVVCRTSSGSGCPKCNAGGKGKKRKKYRKRDRK